MLRNKELKYACIAYVLAGGICGSAVFSESRKGFFWFLAFFVLGFLIFFAGSALRYRKIAALSTYLKRVLNGETGLDVSDNVEGELSLLQNDIYKLVTKLETQAEQLLSDRIFLADSLSDISHQLKTPMTSMMVMTDILRDENLPAEKREEFVAAVQSQLERMEWLLSSLLKMSKLDAGTIQFKREKTTVRELVEKAVEHLLIPMELKNQTFTVRIPESQELVCDFHWTAEAISNIIKNCIEHTPENGTLTIYSESKGIYTQLVVEDNGEGIAPEDLPHIFERFYRGKNAGKDSVGIGLAMAKRILSVQSGQIEALSIPGRGSRFILRLYHLVL